MYINTETETPASVRVRGHKLSHNEEIKKENDEKIARGMNQYFAPYFSVFVFVCLYSKYCKILHILYQHTAHTVPYTHSVFQQNHMQSGCSRK